MISRFAGGIARKKERQGMGHSPANPLLTPNRPTENIDESAGGLELQIVLIIKWDIVISVMIRSYFCRFVRTASSASIGLSWFRPGRGVDGLQAGDEPVLLLMVE